MTTKKTFSGWINVQVQHPQSTEIYYYDRFFIGTPQTATEIKKRTFETLLKKGDTAKFLNTFNFFISK